MLEANPFSNGPTWIDSDRYRKLYLTFPYRPPLTPGGFIPPLTLATTFSDTDTTGSSESYESTVSVSAEGGWGFTSLVKSTLKVEKKWTWTDTKSLTNSTGTSETASVTVTGPSYGYTGSASMAVYYDLLYKSFLFVPVGELPGFEGQIWGNPLHYVMHEIVVTDAFGDEYRTFSDLDGRFQIDGEPQYPLSVVVDDVVLEIRDENQRWVDIRLGEGGSPAFEGQLRADTELSSFNEVTVTDAEGHRYRTVADLDGLFQIYGDFRYPVTLAVGDVVLEIRDEREQWIDVWLN